MPEEPTQSPPVNLEKGGVTESQMAEILSGKFYTIKQISQQLKYSVAWVTMLVQKGKIKAIKPMGGQWRIPESEYKRVISEGLPPMPREKPAQNVTEIQVPEEHVKPKPKAEPPGTPPAKPRGLFPWLFKE